MPQQQLLFDQLIEEDRTLANGLDEIRGSAAEIWNEQSLREFTDHGEPHMDQVERNLDALTRTLQASEDRLSPEETYVLLAACYLHDIGMQFDHDNAREEHAQHTYDLITGSSPTATGRERPLPLPIRDNNAREAIAQVARAHWTDYALRLCETDFIVGNSRGRLRLLGVLLATADLLDLSPVRARYYRTPYHLYDLPAVSELHQRTHDLIQGCEIGQADDHLPDLQFLLSWRHDDPVTRDMALWVVRSLDHDWRRLSPELLRCSHGTVRLGSPWRKVEFRHASVAPQPLSSEARTVLRALRVEQDIVDRDELIASMKGVLDRREAAIVVLTKRPDSDAKHIAAWCQYHSQAASRTCAVARTDLEPGAPLDVSAIVAQLLAQWGGHLPTCNEERALEHLSDFVCDDPHDLVAVVFVEAGSDPSLLRVVDHLVQRPGTGDVPSRLVLLIAPEDHCLDSITTPVAATYADDPFSEQDIVGYLQNRLGYDDIEAGQVYQNMRGTDMLETPGRSYRYLDTHCLIPLS